MEIHKTAADYEIERLVAKIIELEEPDILHAHAMFFCALPAILLGKKYKIPVVYEVRSLWMLTMT